mgnify:CR=1 FL=1
MNWQESQKCTHVQLITVNGVHRPVLIPGTLTPVVVINRFKTWKQ